MTEAEFAQKRLKWQCRRGMLELDIPLNRYVDTAFATGSLEFQASFAKLLALEDPTIHTYLSRQVEPPAEFQEIVHAILACPTN
jgi:antitoxin CptB